MQFSNSSSLRTGLLCDTFPLLLYSEPPNEPLEHVYGMKPSHTGFGTIGSNCYFLEEGGISYFLL